MPGAAFAMAIVVAIKKEKETRRDQVVMWSVLAGNDIRIRT